MTYSFIKPKIKPLFSPFTKAWIFFIIFMVCVMVGFNIFMVSSINSLNKNIKDYKKEQITLNESIIRTNKNIKEVIKKVDLSEEVSASNALLRDSLKNLFDLVPDQITLTKIIMERDSLIIYGKTPTKDAYNFLLSSPLRSIFDSSDVVFYQNRSGWYRFISTNKINNSDGFNE